MSDDDDGPSVIGVYLTPGQVAEYEQRMRVRVRDLDQQVRAASASIIWVKTRDPKFKEAERHFLEASRALMQAVSALE